jgi:hypothetical protein
MHLDSVSRVFGLVGPNTNLFDFLALIYVAILCVFWTLVSILFGLLSFFCFYVCYESCTLCCTIVSTG